MFFDYWRQHRLQIKVARIFNTYGPRTHPNDGRVVSSFIVQALLNRDITVFGEGLQTRSFCYVDDTVDGLIRLMESPTEVTGPINLGNPGEFTILELAKTVIGLVEDVKDISLAEIAARLAEERGLTACPATIWYFFDKRGITHKKRRRTPASSSAWM